MSYSPVRHSSLLWCVRLACIRHAASVHPEPGSNSPWYIHHQSSSLTLLFFITFFVISYWLFLSLYWRVLFSFQWSLAAPSSDCLFILPRPFSFDKPFFNFFIIFLLLLPASISSYSILSPFIHCFLTFTLFELFLCFLFNFLISIICKHISLFT